MRANVDTVHLIPKQDRNKVCNECDRLSVAARPELPVERLRVLHALTRPLSVLVTVPMTRQPPQRSNGFSNRGLASLKRFPVRF